MQLFNLHTHSIFSDGKSTPEDVVLEAINQGLKALGFSDHSPVPFENSFAIKNDEVNNYITTIKSLKEKYKDQIDNLLNSKMESDKKAQIGCKIMDLFIQDVINKYPEQTTKWIFDSNMQMVLTKDQVIKEKDFYNKLFKKHNIDYEINPEVV